MKFFREVYWESSKHIFSCFYHQVVQAFIMAYGLDTLDNFTDDSLKGQFHLLRKNAKYQVVVDWFETKRTPVDYATHHRIWTAYHGAQDFTNKGTHCPSNMSWEKYPSHAEYATLEEEFKSTCSKRTFTLEVYSAIRAYVSSFILETAVANAQLNHSRLGKIVAFVKSYFQHCYIYT